MRVLVVTNLYPPEARGGYETECQGAVEHLRATHDVRVLTSTRGAGADDEPGVHRVLPFGDEGIGPSLRAPLDASRGVRRARSLAEAFRPELVYVFNGAQLPQSALRALALGEAPMAYRVCEHWFGRLYAGDRFLRHLLPGDRGVRAIWASLLRGVNRADPQLRLDLATRVPSAVSWNSAFLRAAVPPPPGVAIVHEAVYLPTTPRAGRFAEVVRRPAAGEPIVFFAGRLDDRKGADVAIRALASLRERHNRSARLVIAGPGSAAERAALHTLAQDLGLGDRTTLAGQLDPAEMTTWLSRCAVWVVPSVWDEPAGMVALEAAAAGVPAVLSRVGGLPEMLREEEEALFFARADADGCADGIQRTLADPEATARRVARARARAARVDWAGYARATDAFVEDAVAAVRAATRRPRR